MRVGECGGMRMDGWVRPWLKGCLGLVLALMLVAPAMAGPYAHARHDGKMNFSYGCPPHSAWNPRGGGQCLACPQGGKLVGTACRRWVKPSYRHAIKVPKEGLLCPKGTYTAVTGCYRCPQGMTHDIYMPLGSAKACRRGRAPHFESYAPRIVKRVSMQQLIDPRKFGDNIGKLGCKAYGPNAFSDSGTCWSCPSTHPIRTPFPHLIAGPKACTTRACGRENGRPCYLWERVPSCNKGLIENPLTNTCVTRPKLGCRAMVNTAKTLINAIREAEKAGKVLSPDKLEKIPGLNALLSFANNQINQVNAQATKLLKVIPVDQAVGSLRRAFPTPDVEAQVSRVLAGIQNRRAAILHAMLDAKTTCSGNPTQLKRIFRDIVRTATAQAYETEWGNLLGVGNAYAGGRHPLSGWSFGVSVEGGFKLSSVPTQVGLEVVVVIDETGDVKVSPLLALGIDAINLREKKHLEVPSADVFAFVGWPHQDTPFLKVGPVSAGAGLLVGNRFGFGFDRGPGLIRTASVRLGSFEKKAPSIPTITITDPDGKTTLLSEMEAALTSGLSSAKQQGKNLLKMEVTFGPNVEVNLTGSDASGSYAY